MENEDKIHSHPAESKPDIDISQKLTHDDIDKIEKYRQTRKTSVLTILFTDIVGYTAFTYDAGEVISGKFRHIHDEIIINQIKKDGYGEIIKQIGDSFLIVFSDPTLAVKQALKLQELFRLNAENLTHKDYQLRIRIGIHMGQVSVEDHIVPDVFGTHVNLASRVLALARPGQVLVTGSVWENASGWLKDDQEMKIQSAYYGKIKLKGIGKATEIYEFYKSETGKAGIPKPISLNKQKKRVLLSVLIILSLLITGSLLVALFKSKPVSHRLTGELARKKIILADINSNINDIRFTTHFSGLSHINSRQYLDKLERSGIEPIDQTKLENTNEKYLQLLKTSFIIDYEFITETDLRLQYAEKGLTVADNLRDDREIANHSDIMILPHLYKFKDENVNFLLVEFQGKSNFFRSDVFSDIDSVPIIINEMVKVAFFEWRKSDFPTGKIIQFSGNDVIIEFDKNIDLSFLTSGIILASNRCYAWGYKDIPDTNIKNRIHDLDKLLHFYGSKEKWIKEIDTSLMYEWTYKEFEDLQHSIVRTQSSFICVPCYIDLKLIKVFDSTALTQIYSKKYPWAELKIGDEVALK
jgi:class 3 adenylate cyclase